MTIQQTTLGNGLKIITANIAEARSLTANIVVGTGGRYEVTGTNEGVSHFLEHLLFKGSKKYPSAEAIALAVDAVGGWNNAYTSEDITSYYIKVPAAHGELALDILADMMTSPLLEPEEIDRERGVVIEEMNVVQDDPARFLHTLIPRLIFPGNQLSEDVLGSEAIISSISAEAIANYQSTHYVPNNMVVAVAGKVDHDAVVAQLTQSLGAVTEGTRPTCAPVEGGPSSELSLTFVKDTAQAHFVIASRGYEYTHADDMAARLLGAILGRGSSSRLFTNVRERQGLAYFIDTDVTSYVDSGIFRAYAGVNVDKTDQAVSSVLAELERIRLEPVTEAELAKCKQQLSAGFEMSLESNSSVADRLGSRMALVGKVQTLDEVIAAIEKVTVADIQRVAQDLLAPEKLRFAIIAPEPEPAAHHFTELVTKGLN